MKGSIKIGSIKIKTSFPTSLHAAVFAYIIFFIFYSILRHYEYLSNGYDLGIFMQSLWTTSNNQGFFFNTPEWLDLGVSSHFGVHNQTILLLLVPLYKLFPRAETLLITQTVALGFAAYPLYLLTKRISEDEKVAMFTVIMYLLNPGIHGINRFDFHPVSLAVPFIFLTVYFMENGEIKKALLSLLFVLSVKEDAGLVPIALGLFFILKDHELREFLKLSSFWRICVEKKLEIGMICLGILWIFLSIFVVIPHFNPSGYPYFSASTKLGEYYYNYKEIFWGVQERIGLIFGYTIILFASVVFLPLFKPRLLLAIFPLWAENVLSGKKTQIVIGYQYTYMIVPVMIVISAYVLSDMNNGRYPNVFRRVGATMKRCLLFLALVSVFFSPVFHVVDTKYVSGPNVQNLIELWSIGSEYFHALDTTVSILNQNAGSCLIATQNYIFPHFANRKETYYIVTPFNSTFFNETAVYVVEATQIDYDLALNSLREYPLSEPPIVFNMTRVILKCYAIPHPHECIEREVQKAVGECLKRKNNRNTS
jgi:uncharacterized membrane protein